jgi:palmitoyl transferase
MRLIVLAATVLVTCLQYSYAEEDNRLSAKVKAEVRSEVQSKEYWISRIWQEGSREFYLPLHTYHLRFAYDQSKIDQYNENPWGFGFGKGLRDDQDDWRGVYAMGFHDSHDKFEPFAGYAYLHPFSNGDNVRWSIGYTVGITARSDIGHYTPFPAVLPLASVEYGRVSLWGAYVPGGHNFGNVLFFFGKYQLAN